MVLAPLPHGCLPAAESRTTVTALIEQALRERLARRRRQVRSQPVRLTTFGSKGLQPGVDLDDSAALLDLMEPGSSAFTGCADLSRLCHLAIPPRFQ